MASSRNRPPAVRVGVTGHQDLNYDVAIDAFRQCMAVLESLRDIAEFSCAELECYSCLAAGADQIFARAALDLGAPLIGVVPCTSYERAFVDAQQRRQYKKYRSRCQRLHRLDHSGPSQEAYNDAGRWIVDNVDFIVALWNGKRSRSLGGTGDIVAYSREKSVKILWFDTVRCVWRNIGKAQMLADD